MSSTYLERFRSTLPQYQGNQLLQKLIAKRDSGEIRTIDEFKAQLKKLTIKLLEQKIKPTIELYLATAGEDASSEQYTTMLQLIHDDLETAFAEANNMDDIIDAHHNLIEEVSLRALRYGVNELESKVNMYEFLNRNGGGYDDALANTFREPETLSSSRSVDDAALIYVDPRKVEPIPVREDALIDLIGERLVMGTEASAYVSVREAVWLSNANSDRSELDVQFEGSNINNVIDGATNTYWINPILKSSVRSNGVLLEVALRTYSSQDINFVDIEPATEFPMQLVQVDVMDSNGVRTTISTDNVLMAGPVRINFGRVTTSYLILRFQQDNYKEIQFQAKQGTSNFHRAVLGQNNVAIDVSSVSEDLERTLSSNYILADIFQITSQVSNQSKYFEYVMGFDNIRPGYNKYNDRAIFISTKKEITYPAQIALRTEEQLPVQLSGSTDIDIDTFDYPARTGEEDARFYHGAIEYWLVMKLYSEDNFLISTDILPLLPLGATRVYHEQLVLTHNSSVLVLNADMGRLRFYCDDDSDDVRIYRNGVLLNYGTDWEFVPASGAGANTDLTYETSNGGKSMRRGIKLLVTINPLDIFTASYSPKVSNTRALPVQNDLFDVVDLTGDQSVRLVADNITVIDSVRQAQTVAKADIYLSIIMRRNSANQSFSPIIEEYMLLTGSRDLTKFVSDF